MSSPNYPLLLSTWSFGLRANAAGWAVLQNGRTIIDAVEAACRDAEEDLSNPTVGVGGLPDSSGRISLDAAMMLSPSRRGGVAVLRRHAAAISAARAVMERTPHVLIAGPDADDFADSVGIPQRALDTPQSAAAYEKWKSASADRAAGDAEHPFAATQANIEELGYGGSSLAIDEANHDTIGVLGIGSDGLMVGGCTTSGLAFKLPGRVGDSPVVGHSVYVDPAVGAAVATGHGELMMSHCGGFLAVEMMRQGRTPLEAGQEVIRRIAQNHTLSNHDQLGVIVLRKDGTWSSVSLQSGFRVAYQANGVAELRTPEWMLR